LLHDPDDAAGWNTDFTIILQSGSAVKFRRSRPDGPAATFSHPLIRILFEPGAKEKALKPSGFKAYLRHARRIPAESAAPQSDVPAPFPQATR